MYKINITNDISMRLIFILVGIFSSAYIFSNDAPRQGLEYLFLIPLAFSLCVLFFGDIIQYHKNGIGLKIFYIFVLVRYIVSPVLISKTKYLHYMLRNVEQSSYQLSVWVIITELIVMCIAIKISWWYYHKSLPKESQVLDPAKISIVNWLICGFIILLCILRRDRFLDGVRFLFLSTNAPDYVGSFEGISLLVVKSFLFIRFLIYAKSKYEMNQKLRWVIATGILAFFNISIYYGDNRSLVLQTAVSTIYTFISAFPKYKKSIMISLVPLSFMIIFSMVVVRQIGTNIGEISSSKNVNNLQFYSQNIELYTNGVWPIASAIDITSEQVPYSISLLTAYADFAKNFFPFFIPGFDQFKNFIMDTPTTAEIYNISAGGIGAMLPLAGQMWMYGGNIFGLFLDILANVSIVFLLVKFEIISKLGKSIQNKFLYTWLSTLFAFIMSYCLITLIWSWSKFALLLGFLHFTNRLVIRKNKNLSGSY